MPSRVPNADGSDLSHAGQVYESFVGLDQGVDGEEPQAWRSSAESGGQQLDRQQVGRLAENLADVADQKQRQQRDGLKSEAVGVSSVLSAGSTAVSVQPQV
ncbi:MAG: hypothetical protein QG667_485 [Pseudomonadota bacterium]|nr:hypothetical protein [Pseudomonadota bacterium]